MTSKTVLYKFNEQVENVWPNFAKMVANDERFKRLQSKNKKTNITQLMITFAILIAGQTLKKEASQ